MQTSNSTPYGYIYKITNPINGKCYIGQTISNPCHRWEKYKNLRCKKQIKLYNALCKYGSKNFLYEILDTAPDQIVLDYLEDFYIQCLDTRKNGYNCREGGAHGKMAEETKLKLSKINKGKSGYKHSYEAKQKISNYQKGKPKSKEAVIKMISSLTGIKRSDEYKKKQSEIIKASWLQRKQQY